MPTPLLLLRPSGVYAHFFVPSDLQPSVGLPCLVRPLRHPPDDDRGWGVQRLNGLPGGGLVALKKN
jgi:hypothetical protein